MRATATPRRCDIAIALLWLAALAACHRQNPAPVTVPATGLRTDLIDARGRSYVHEFVVADGRRIETVWARPPGDGPFPLLVMVHGYQGGARPGARYYLARSRLQRLVADWGVVAVSVSQPGFGNSQGRADFCGPRTQRAVLAVIEQFAHAPFIDRQRVALMGFSRGAIVASMLATRETWLAAVVLWSGFYDVGKFYRDNGIAGIQPNIDRETGSTPEAFRERSALPLADRIRSPTLILHGALDPRGGVAEARQLGAVIARNGVPSAVRIYEGEKHYLDDAVVYPDIGAFLARHLRLSIASDPASGPTSGSRSQ